MLTLLPAELMTIVAEQLDVRSLRSFASASAVCQSAAHDLLLEALRERVWQFRAARAERERREDDNALAQLVRAFQQRWEDDRRC